MRRATVLLLLPVLVACGGPGAGDDAAPGPRPTSSASPTPTPSPDDGGSDAPSPGAAPARTPACAEVRAGIDAFNEGDYDETVARFAEAVPLAEQQLDGSERADDLLEAVEWYAALPPEDYPEAAISSQEFQVYKAITLTQCDPVPEGPGPGGSGPSTPPPVEA